MKSTSSAASLDSEPRLLHEEEVPDPPQLTMDLTATVTQMPGTTPTTTPPPTLNPQPSPAAPRPHPSLLPTFQALAMVLSARLQGLILTVSAIVSGFLVISDPTPLRLVAGAGYAVFCLAALWVIPKR